MTRSRVCEWVERRRWYFPQLRLPVTAAGILEHGLGVPRCGGQSIWLGYVLGLSTLPHPSYSTPNTSLMQAMRPETEQSTCCVIGISISTEIECPCVRDHRLRPSLHRTGCR